MPERFVGIDVALRDHRAAVLDRDGEAVGKSFTIPATKDGVTALLEALRTRGATAVDSVIGLEASGHLWENLEAALVGAGYRVLVLNPVQTRRYRDLVRRKAKTDDIDAMRADRASALGPARTRAPSSGQVWGTASGYKNGASETQRRALLGGTLPPRRPLLSLGKF